MRARQQLLEDPHADKALFLRLQKLLVDSGVQMGIHTSRDTKRFALHISAMDVDLADMSSSSKLAAMVSVQMPSSAGFSPTQTVHAPSPKLLRPWEHARTCAQSTSGWRG